MQYRSPPPQTVENVSINYVAGGMLSLYDSVGYNVSTCDQGKRLQPAGPNGSAYNLSSYCPNPWHPQQHCPCMSFRDPLNPLGSGNS